MLKVKVSIDGKGVGLIEISDVSDTISIEVKTAIEVERLISQLQPLQTAMEIYQDLKELEQNPETH